MIPLMPSLILPTLGPFHILHPRYNAVTVLELTRQWQPQALLLASYGPQEWSASTWRDANDLPLFHLWPFAEDHALPVRALDSLAHLKAEAEAFRTALGQFPKGLEILKQMAQLEQSLQELLTTPLLAQDLSSTRFLDSLWSYLNRFAASYQEGPATGFRQMRMQQVAQAITGLPEGRYVILADLLDYPYLLELPGVQPPQAHASTEAEANRALLDRAWRLEDSDDLGGLLAQLQEVGNEEAQYLAAQIYLSVGQIEDALHLMEALVNTNFHHPAYLPGYVLSRYGQLQDLSGNRSKALRAYQAALALSWIPLEAKEIALAGQRTPFQMQT